VAQRATENLAFGHVIPLVYQPPGLSLHPSGYWNSGDVLEDMAEMKISCKYFGVFSEERHYVHLTILTFSLLTAIYSLGCRAVKQ